ncbi:MAG TPA: DUF2344 domain-containing protein [Firmicutes bacterium]|nr:DUF2344 domain-containing protein [Bacillota bacterium]
MPQKLWARLIKGPEVRFISHLDLLGTVEKALRRAQVPIAFSQGYNPQPKIAFAAALPVGMTSSGEYAEFILGEPWPLEYFREQVNRQLLPGLELEAVREVPGGYPALMAIVDLARYQMGLKLPAGIKKEHFSLAWEGFLSREEVKITRQTRKGVRNFNLIPYVYGYQIHCDSTDLITVTIDLKLGPRGSVRPGEVVETFWTVSGWEGRVVFLHREGLYIVRDDGIYSPLTIEFQHPG